MISSSKTLSNINGIIDLRLCDWYGKKKKENGQKYPSEHKVDLLLDI